MMNHCISDTVILLYDSENYSDILSVETVIVIFLPGNISRGG